MGDALSKSCGDEPADAAAQVAPPPAARAPTVAAPVNRRRIKGTPTRVLTAASTGSIGSGGRRKGRKQKKQKAGPQAAATPACPATEQPAPAPPGAEAAVAAPAPPGPPTQPAAHRAGCKRKAPEPSSSPRLDAGLAKRHQLLGLAFLTLGTLTGMAPFALPRRSAAPGHPAGAGAEVADAATREAATEEEEAAEVVGQAAATAVTTAASAEQEAVPTAQAETAGAAPVLEQQAPGQQGQSAVPEQQASGRLAADGTPAVAPPAACQPPPPGGSHEATGAAADPAQEQQPAAVQREEQPVPGVELEQQAEQGEPAAMPLPAPRPPEQEVGAAEVTPASVLPACPLSAAKPLNRSQLRQQLLQSQRTAGPGGASPVLSSAMRGPAGTPPSVTAQSTRGQRMLGLARRKTLPAHAAAAAEAPPADASTPAVPVEHAEHAVTAAAAVQEGEQMQLDQPDGAAAVPAEQPSVPAAQLAQRRLTQSPLRQPSVPDGSTAALQQQLVTAAAADGDADKPIVAASPSAAAGSPQLPPADGSGAITPQPRRSTPPTPLTADPGSAARPALGCAPGLPGGSPASPVAEAAAEQPCSSAQSPVANEGAVRAALQQIGALLIDLRGGSPQPPRVQRPSRAAQEPAPCRGAGQGAHGGGPARHTGLGGVAAQGDNEAQSALAKAPSPTPPQQQQQQQPGAASPRSPPEVCSRPQEAGADNFPGFWRQPALGGGSSGAAGAGCTPGRARKRPAADGSVAVGAGVDDGFQDQPPRAAPGRARRVRFGESKLVRFALPEPEEAAEGAAAGMPVPAPLQQQQQLDGPTPLVVAPPVLPAGASGVAGRPATPAKPTHLPMPQPPAHARLGAVAFRRPYCGPQGRRQALLSFVSEGGATCYAVAPAPPPAGEADGADGGVQEPGGGPASGCGQMLIPRRLQHREGLRRRSLLPAPPPQQGAELLEQEVREAFINARLADHLRAGDAWARLDMAGCELAPGAQHAEALAQARRRQGRELSGKLEQAQGPGAVRQLLEQLDSEWLHLKRLRQYATQGSAAAAAAAAVAGEGEGGGAGAGSSRPRGILKHRSSLGSGSIALAKGADADAAAASATARAEASADGHPSGLPQPAEQPTEQLPVAGAAGTPASFEAVLAAAIVHELPAAASTPAAAAAAALPTAEAQQSAPAADASTTDNTAAPAADSLQGADAAPMDIDAAAEASVPAQVAAAEPCGTAPSAAHAAGAAGGEPERASELPAGMPQQSAAALEAPGEAASQDQGQPEPSLEPRPVELNPGPELSRGAKMLQRCTPAAAGKVQQLLQAAGERGRRARAAPPLGPAKLLHEGGAGLAAGGPARRGQSRGERLLAALRGAAGGGAAATSPGLRSGGGGGLAVQAGGGAAEGSPQRPLQVPEEGPTVAPAAAVLLGS